MDHCLLRVRPPDAEMFVGLDEWSGWEPCPNPATYKVFDRCAPGGFLMLCKEHSRGMPHQDKDQWE